MRINKLLYIGRLELYIGRRTHWAPQWRASRVAHGVGLWAGHWHVLAAWLPPRQSDAELEAELLAQAAAWCRAEGARCWPARWMP